jgi:hypothetical protein
MVDQISKVKSELNSSEYLERINEFYSDIISVRIYSISIEKIYNENWKRDELRVGLYIGDKKTNIYEFDINMLDDVEILKREIIICHLNDLITQLDLTVFKLWKENS